MQSIAKPYVLYVLRWQLSTPILAAIMYIPLGTIPKTILANFIGALIFYWVDKMIFRRYS